MHRIFVAFILVLDGSVGLCLGQEAVNYNRDIRPILSNNCFQCHGMDANTREAGLRLDLQSSAHGKLESGGRAIVPGEPENSVLLEYVSAEDPDDRMPPPESGKSLDSDQIELLAKWIQQGGGYEQHWSFIPPAKSPAPATGNRQWAINQLDQFILERIEQVGLRPSAEATRRELIRRVAFDLTGLPPTPEEIDGFVRDSSPNAYETMLDHFLASPHFGEHMAKHWLDLARYADSNGYQYDTERTMWVWRDWVIDAFNRNMRFDQFTIEQLAGDLLPNATDQQILATGFNRNHPITIEGGVIDEEYRTEYVIDRLNTTATTWLGLTMGCARCHDHKFDPISQREFYQLSAYFNQVPERGLNGFQPSKKIVSPLAEPIDAEILNKIESLQLRIADLERRPDASQVEQWAAGIAAEMIPDWQLLAAEDYESSGGSTMVLQDDGSILVGGANPRHDTYTIRSETTATGLTAIRLECLTDDSLPGGGPGRHSNSNFVLSEFELIVRSKTDPQRQQKVKFSRAVADYSQANYDVARAIDGQVKNSNGWAVDGPVRKQPATAIFIAESAFGFDGGTVLEFRMRHEADFATHGIGRFRLSACAADPTQLGAIQRSRELVAAAKLPAAERTKEESGLLVAELTKINRQRAKLLRESLDRLMPESQYPPTLVMRDADTLRPTYVLERGQYDLKGETVEPNVPRVLGKLDEKSPADRLGLARWLVRPDNPLTARVAVNRYWQMLFGIGLVSTPEDFGLQGAWPSHPELLDTLAVQFVESGWDVKAMLKYMMMSATYRQSSEILPENLEIDPANRWLARAPRLRLDAEQIRDHALGCQWIVK